MTTRKRESWDLTEKMEDVLRAIAYGISDADIACHLGIGVEDVRTEVGKAIEALHNLPEI